MCRFVWILLLLVCCFPIAVDGFVPSKTPLTVHVRIPWATETSYERNIPQLIVYHNPKEENSSEIDCLPDEPDVPRTMREALSLFWTSKQYPGPRWVVLSLASLVGARLMNATPFSGLMDVLVFFGAILVWVLQEHWIHGKLLHSTRDWFGKEIHQNHHAKPYYHISMDPAPLLMAWLWSAYLVFHFVLPTNALAMTATLGYACAGLFYEWTHFLVHTRVPFRRDSFWRQRKDHHQQHHLLDNRYWLSFSVPSVDSLFGTRPQVQDVVLQQRQLQQEQKA